MDIASVRGSLDYLRSIQHALNEGARAAIANLTDQLADKPQPITTAPGDRQPKGDTKELAELVHRYLSDKELSITTLLTELAEQGVLSPKDAEIALECKMYSGVLLRVEGGHIFVTSYGEVL